MLTSAILSFLAAHYLPIAAVLLAVHLTRNYFCHGLHRYPGPWLARLTDFWRLWDVYNQAPHKTHRALHARHGDVVRLGPNVLSFSSPAAVKDIYGLNKGYIKSDFYIVQQSIVQGRRLASLFSTTSNAFHATFRRCVSSAFAMSALVGYEPFVDNTTRLFLDRTEELFAQKPNSDAPESCDLPRWLQFYAFDVIGEITYSKRHGFIERNEDVDGIVGYLAKLFVYVAPVGQMPFLDLLFLKNPLYLKLSQWGLVDSTFPVAQFSRTRLAERVPNLSSSPDILKPTSSPSKPDLLTKFLNAHAAHPSVMTPTLVQTMAVSMAFAGSETTAITLSAIFYMLLRHPRALDALRDEIDAAASRGHFADRTTGLTTFAEAQRLPYLGAVIQEAFRVHPAAGLPLERITPAGGAVIDGRHVAGGTIVGVSAWVLHQRPEIFGADADNFRPERWLVDPTADPVAEEKRLKTMNGFMLQFGMGSRTCIGKNISLLEIYKLVPSMLRRFDITLANPEEEWKLINAWFVKVENFNVNLKRRELVQPETSL
ncbi:Pisatin demethylase [Ceratocystis platani]|uniref:Pisatin demethylase n=1 Tax=Ceratocystis fimbriata f. sp. platani TaxID=88771 RepID=A0A0F8CR54_CERFI|nr:Pisatin demethylase [Ceratocystis platani]